MKKKDFRHVLCSCVVALRNYGSAYHDRISWYLNLVLYSKTLVIQCKCGRGGNSLTVSPARSLLTISSRDSSSDII